MEKEFEAIRDDKLRIGLLGLKRLFKANAKKMTKDEIMAFDFTFMNITNALIELQTIKEAKPSEALKTLGILEQIISPLLEPLLAEYEDDLSDKITANYFALKQTLLKAQELEKENAEYKQLEKQLDCSPEVVIKALQQSEFEGLVVNKVDTDDRKWAGLQRCNLRYDTFNDRFYWCNGYFCIPLSEYKKHWWLKKDKSE